MTNCPNGWHGPEWSREFRMIARIALCATLACLIVGCTDVRSARVESPKTPRDFSVDVTILTGSGAKDLPQAHLRQGKFTVLADGSLHSDYGESLDFSTRPLPSRWLYRSQMDGFWKLVCEEGWADPSTSSIDIWPGSVRPARDEVVYILCFHADGTDWWYVRRFTTTELPDPHAVALVRSLCDLAWSTDRAADRNLPHRYDFGPNPYDGFTKAPPFSFAKSPTSSP